MIRLTRINGQPAAAAWKEYSFVPDEDNVIEAPDDALEALACFGFVPAPPKTATHTLKNIFLERPIAEALADGLPSKKRKLTILNG